MVHFWSAVKRMLSVLLLVQIALVSVLTIARKVRPKRTLPTCAVVEPEQLMIGDTVVQVHTNGPALYRDMLDTIARAQKMVLFETFLWRGDESGWAFREALIERARAGVDVYIIYDRLVNVLESPAFKNFPELPTLHVMPYRSIRRPWHIIDPRRFGRDHRKILAVDGQVAYVGGFNIGNLYRDWRDTQIKLSGPAAADIAHAFAEFWNHEPGARQITGLPAPACQPEVQVFCNDRRRLKFPIRAMYIDAIDRAQKQILITQAYFMPDRAMLNALCRAAQRGVDVQILMPWESNHPTADWLSRHRFGRCLNSGVRVFGYLGPILHAKTATIDGCWTTIGTANMDRLSLLGSNEVNAIFYNRELAQQMAEVFACDLRSSREILRAQWDERPWYRRVTELIISPLWPFV